MDVLRGTGVRIAEAINPSWVDVDFETGLLEVASGLAATQATRAPFFDWLVSRLREIANHLGHSDIGSTMIYMDRRQGSPRAATAL